MLPVLEDLYTRMGFEFDRRPAFMRIPGAVSGTGEDKLLDFVAPSQEWKSLSKRSKPEVTRIFSV